MIDDDRVELSNLQRQIAHNTQRLGMLKAILGIGESLRGRLLIWNALEMSFFTVRVPRNRECSACGDDTTITELVDGERSCGTG